MEGKADLALVLQITQERSEFVDFFHTLFTSNLALVTVRNDNGAGN